MVGCWLYERTHSREIYVCSEVGFLAKKERLLSFF